ncbi:thyroid receptor-interacting protein 11-like [Cylas formicarius]|uniref:thyroid receptor-interacting protein 11-like n=1 Tax=Cylas formicarius TaxID=197179 RepID=UPI002958A37F|nr:thyroid receptor-interacting protein 11-like [Cylas formicarius]
MSSWLNLNESLNSLKGQISNFASNVLADDEAPQMSDVNYEELKRICIQQELEIEKLKSFTKALQSSKSNNEKQNGELNQNSWDWDTAESAEVDLSTADEISDLRKYVSTLKNENRELANQLEQLDSEHQQNIAELVKIKENLQEENETLKAKFKELKQNHEILRSSEEKLKRSSKRVENDRDSQELLQELGRTKTELSVLKSAHQILEQTLNDTKMDAKRDLNAVLDELKKSEAENRIIYGKLQKSKELVETAELKNREDAKNCEKLAFILETYEKQVSELKNELGEASNNQAEMKAQLKKLEKSKQILQGELDVANSKLAEFESKFALLDNITDDTEEKALKGQMATVVAEKESLHKMYVNIITENVKRYTASQSSDLLVEPCEDPHLLEFSKQVENIFNILSELKSKCEHLENENLEISREKTQILTEKNYEIEKLMQNSEDLSQEIMSKSEAIKELENEIYDLGKNNELLMSELNDHKNAGLQTISESNEDNMVLLENQLENANRRIKELEETIGNSLETRERSMPDGAAKEDTNEKSEGSSDIPESLVGVSKTERDYRELLNSFDDLKIDYDLMKNELENTKNDLELADKENEELRTHLERARADFENTEYQLTEANITIDTLHEELQTCKAKIDTLVEENRKLGELKTESEKSNTHAKSEMNTLRELLLNEENRRREFEAQTKNLTEKLQNAKMVETTLKLQYDTLSKDYSGSVEAKKKSEQTLETTKGLIQEYEQNYNELLQKYDSILLKCEDLNTRILEKENELLRIEGAFNEVQQQKSEMEKVIEHKECKLLSLDRMLKDLQQEREELKNITNGQTQPQESKEGEPVSQEKMKLEQEIDNLQQALKQSIDGQKNLQQQLADVTNSRNELIGLITTKHQESLSYHNEVQRLSQLLKSNSEKCEKLESQLAETQSSFKIEELTDQINFLKEKCDILGKQVLEKSGPSEKELSLSKQLERLQSHLVEIQEHYTQELLQVEQKNGALQTKLNELQQREKDSSTMYTSVSIRANQQLETLQSQLQIVTNQRDELRKKISDAEDQNSKQAAALANLQFVLEQFQRDKEKDVMKETDRIRRQITTEKRVQEDLRNEIVSLKSQLDESKQGLQAASRLSDQLELSKKQNLALKEEVTQLQGNLLKSEQTLHKLTNHTEGKVDKSLIKNLIVGFLSSGNANSWNKDQAQILKIIATVLDFNQQDHEKVKLNQPQQGWLGSILFPQSAAHNISQESLSQAFIKFLETESKPREIPSLLDTSRELSKPSTSSDSSRRNTPRVSPIILSEIVLPTFADFGQNRNSSSILKDVLKDNS